MALRDPSSPLSSLPPTQSSLRQPLDTRKPTPYRSAKELPFELAQHVQTYYEENLFTPAYNFLLSITGNSASSANRVAPLTIPPPSHLALAATVAVHPVFTTRTHSREKWEQANAALRLLRVVYKTAGPVNADFVTAFSFRKYAFRSSRHSGVRFEGDHDEDEDVGRNGNGEPSREHDLNTPFAGLQGIWARAEDFWQLVGWAFNCACLSGIHMERWNHYRLLLEFLVDVLETDWRIRNEGPNPCPEESLVWQYIELAAGGHARARRILRAIFADGSTRSTDEFRAIFTHELKEPPAQETKMKKRQVDVNIDKDIYGDYLAQDDSDLSDDGDVTSTGTGAGGRPSKRARTGGTQTPSSRRVTPRSSTGSLRSEYDNGEDSGRPPSRTASLGEPACIHLRLRLLRLLTHISSHPTLTSTSPTTFPDLEDLFTLFVEFIKPLPLPVFAQIMLSPTTPSKAEETQQPQQMPSQSQSQHPLPLQTPARPRPHAIFDAQTHTTLSESLLQRLLETSAPSIRSHALLSQTKLEDEYLPFAAGRNNADSNARVSLMLETLTRCLAQLGLLTRTDSLKDALSRGVERRMARVLDAAEGKKGSGRTTNKGATAVRDQLAWACLVESGERIGLAVDDMTE